MFGLFKRSTEERSGRVDIGELYSASFGFGGTSYSWQVSPAVLASSSVDGRRTRLAADRIQTAREDLPAADQLPALHGRRNPDGRA